MIAVMKGHFGDVKRIAAVDKDTGEKVAIKKIFNIFKDLVDTKHVLREITLLRKLKHENVIGLHTILMPSSPSYQDIYLITDLMQSDLSKLIASHVQLSEEHFQTFTYQILRGLKFIHSAGVVHRDLKPSNLLINSNCDLKISDLGMSRHAGPKLTLTLLDYVTTRYYRAPEGLFSSTQYTSAVDVWSVGCILAELITGKPVLPGRENYNQLELIIQMLGTPSQEDLAAVQHQDKMLEFLSTLPPCQPTPLKQYLPDASQNALGLLSRMLVFDPLKRITVVDALAHPFLADLHDKEDEPVAAEQYSDELDARKLSESDYAGLIYNEISRYHPRATSWETFKLTPHVDS